MKRLKIDPWKLRTLVSSGMTCSEIAEHLGVSKPSVRKYADLYEIGDRLRETGQEARKEHCREVWDLKKKRKQKKNSRMYNKIKRGE